MKNKNLDFEEGEFHMQEVLEEGSEQEASETVPETPEKKRKVWKIALEWSIYISILLIGIVVVPKYVMHRTIVSGPSMENTLHNGESLLVSMISYELGEPERFDIITFYPYGKNQQSDEDDIFVKRVIGLPGETVQIVGTDILINGKKLEEHYGKTPIVYYGCADTPIILAEDEYFVLGDNRKVSYDSRDIGPVKRENIEAKVFLRIWPLSGFGTVD